MKESNIVLPEEPSCPASVAEPTSSPVNEAVPPESTEINIAGKSTNYIDDYK